jgi:hypothetical protein
MIRRAGNFGCGCDAPRRAPGMGGIFSTLLDVAGAYVGDPGLGDQVASQSPLAFGPITQTPAQIATTIAPDVTAAMGNLAAIDTKNITSASQQIATSILPQTAAAMTAAGVVFPPGSVGANLQHPTVLNAFGGQDAEYVLIGGLALAALLLFKEF